MPIYPCNAKPILPRTLKSLDRNHTRNTSLTATVMIVNNSILWKKSPTILEGDFYFLELNTSAQWVPVPRMCFWPLPGSYH